MIAKKLTTALTTLILALMLPVPARLGHAATLDTASAQRPDFSMSFFSNPIRIKRGSGGGFQIEIQPSNGFTGVVHFEITDSLPPGITQETPSSFDVPVSGTGITFTDCDFIVPKHNPNAPTGTFLIGMVATSGTLSHSLTGTLTIR